MVNWSVRSAGVLAISALGAWCVLIALANLYNLPPFDITPIILAIAVLLVATRIAFQLALATPIIGFFAILFIALSIRLVFVFLVPNQPVSDFATVYEAASTLSSTGNVSGINNSPYFQLFSFQIPMTLFEALIIYLSGYSLIAICFAMLTLSALKGCLSNSATRAAAEFACSVLRW